MKRPLMIMVHTIYWGKIPGYSLKYHVLAMPCSRIDPIDLCTWHPSGSNLHPIQPQHHLQGYLRGRASIMKNQSASTYLYVY